jgi:hypothetical protein
LVRFFFCFVFFLRVLRLRVQLRLRDENRRRRAYYKKVLKTENRKLTTLQANRDQLHRRHALPWRSADQARERDGAVL